MAITGHHSLDNDGNRNGKASPGANHGQDEHDCPYRRLNNVGDEEEAWAECAPRSLNDADDVENEAHDDDEQNDHQYGDGGGDAGAGAVMLLQLVVNVVRVGGNHADCEAVHSNLEQHDQNPDDPEGDQDPLHERRIADNLMRPHA